MHYIKTIPGNKKTLEMSDLNATERMNKATNVTNVLESHLYKTQEQHSNNNDLPHQDEAEDPLLGVELLDDEVIKQSTPLNASTSKSISLPLWRSCIAAFYGPMVYFPGFPFLL